MKLAALFATLQHRAFRGQLCEEGSHAKAQRAGVVVFLATLRKINAGNEPEMNTALKANESM